MKKTKKFQRQFLDNRQKNQDIHLHSLYIQEKGRLSQGPYNSLKQQIKYGNNFNPNAVKKENDPQQIQDQIEKIFENKQPTDISKFSNIKKVILKPVINNNYTSGFNQSQYDLKEQDKVKIVKQRVFKVQNYYNYLYELKFNQKAQQIKQKLELQFKKARSEALVKKSSNQNERFIRQDSKKEQEKFKLSNVEKSKNLAPVHQRYEEQRMQDSYYLKEKDRQKIQQKFKQKYQSSENFNFRESYKKDLKKNLNNSSYNNQELNFNEKRNNYNQRQKFGFGSGNIIQSQTFKF